MRNIAGYLTIALITLVTANIAYGKVLVLKKPIMIQGTISVESLVIVNREIIKSVNKTVNIYIDSEGGDMYAILHTVDLMDKAKNNRNVKFRCYVKMGYSAAMYLYSACNWRYASTKSTLLYHDGRAVMFGYFGHEYLLKEGNSLKKMNFYFNAKIRSSLKMGLEFYNDTKNAYWLAPDLLEASHPDFLKIMDGVKLK